MIRQSNSLRKQRGVISIEAMAGAMLVALMIVAAGGAVKYRADYENDKVAADTLNIVFQGAQDYFTKNYSTISAAATPSVTYPFSTWQGSVSSAITGTNIYRQTYSLRVFKEPSGQLDMAVITTGGDSIPDGSLLRIAKMLGGSGGYVSNAAPAIVQNPAAGWSMPAANFGALPGGGHLAASSFFANAAAIQAFLYRNVLPGHPEVNQMSTAIDMQGNDINNGGILNGAQVVTPAGGNIKVGDSIFYGDTQSTAVRQSGAFYVQHMDGSSADIAQVANITATGKIATSGIVQGGQLQLLDVMTEGTGCSQLGAEAIDGTGAHLYCILWVWKGPSKTENPTTAYGFGPYASNVVPGQHRFCAVGYTEEDWSNYGNTYAQVYAYTGADADGRYGWYAASGNNVVVANCYD